MKITKLSWTSRLGTSDTAASASTNQAEAVATAKPPDTYDLLFIGLICFLNDNEDSRLVLLPDGTDPGKKITPHFPYVVVDPRSVIEAKGWEGLEGQLKELAADGMFPLPKCTLSIDGVDNGKGLVTKQHDQDVPKLVDVDSTVKIDPAKARAIVRLNVTRGTLEAFRRPETEEDRDPTRDPSDVAIISRLRVPYKGEITVKVTPPDGPERFLRLKAETDIALANVAFPDEGTGQKHFPIYGKLTTRGSIKDGTPRPIPQTIPRLPADHHFFDFEIPITDGGSQCGNQGCCRKPGT